MRCQIKRAEQLYKVCKWSMAHLCIGERTSFNKLVSMLSAYKQEKDRSADTFVKAECDGFIGQIAEFCIFRGGYDYWQRVQEAAR